MNTKAKSLADIAGLQSFPPVHTTHPVSTCMRGGSFTLYLHTQKSTVAPESRWGSLIHTPHRLLGFSKCLFCMHMIQCYSAQFLFLILQVFLLNNPWTCFFLYWVEIRSDCSLQKGEIIRPLKYYCKLVISIHMIFNYACCRWLLSE